MDKITSTNGTTIESQNVCLLYESTTGVIRHRHNTVTLKGGKQPAQAEIESDALTFASRAGVETAGLVALHLGADALSAAGHYEVDPAARTLKFTAVAPAIKTVQPEPITLARPPLTRL